MNITKFFIVAFMVFAASLLVAGGLFAQDPIVAENTAEAIQWDDCQAQEQTELTAGQRFICFFAAIAIFMLTILVVLVVTDSMGPLSFFFVGDILKAGMEVAFQLLAAALSSK